MVKEKKTLEADFAPRTKKETPSMREAFPDPEPMVHLTIQVPASLRDQIRAAAKAEGLNTRIWITSLVKKKLKT